MATPENPIRILSIDGGGMRGIIPAMILSKLDALIASRLEERGQPPQRLASFFDVIAGTSTGAIIAAGLAGRRDQRPLTPASSIRAQAFQRVLCLLVALSG